MEIRGEPYLHWPKRMKSDHQTINQKRYCRFHRNLGHDTMNCIQLNHTLEDLVHRELMNKFIAKAAEQQQQRAGTPPPIDN